MNPPIITIFCSFTRRWTVERFLENLKKTMAVHKPENTNLAFIVDIDEIWIQLQLQRFADEHGYRACEIIRNSEHHPNEVRLRLRRLMIADMKNQSKKLIAKLDGEYVIGLEDDTVFDLDCFCRLLKPLYEDASVGFVEGVQCGRWGIKMIGAWQTDNVFNPHKISTLMPKTGYEQIDAGGFYGYATRKNLYLEHDYFSSNGQPFGPDVNFGLWLRQQGYQCIIDWDTIFGHNDHNVILYPDADIKRVEFAKNIAGEWLQEDTV